MRILLAVPPFAEEGLEMDAKESIGIGYLASVLREQACEVDLLDADLLGLTPEETTSWICGREYDLIGFSLLEGTFDSAVEIIRRVREKGSRAHIVLGGHFPTLVTEELLRKLGTINSIILGEGEYPLLELTRRLSAGKDWRDLNGIAYRHGDQVIVNGAGPLPDLDILPFPSRDLLPEVLRRGGGAGIVGSRGCFANCSFCCVHPFGTISGHPGWRGRDPERIADEIETLINRWKVKIVSFYDSNFVGPGEEGRSRAFSIAEEILRRDLRIQFAIATRPDQVEEGLFAFLKDAGLKEVFIGIESMSQKSLDLYNKKTTVEQNGRAIDILEKLEIEYRPGYILYEPYVTLDQIRENLEYLRELIQKRYCKKYHFFKGLRVYRGSPLEEILIQRGVLIENGWHHSYSWQNPEVARFIAFAGTLGSRMIPLMARGKSRRELDPLLGRWSIDTCGDILSLIERGGDGSDPWVELALKADEGLSRIEKTLGLS